MPTFKRKKNQNIVTVIAPKQNKKKNNNNKRRRINWYLTYILKSNSISKNGERERERERVLEKVEKEVCYKQASANVFDPHMCDCVCLNA